MPSSQPYAGRRALITGASAGLGAEFARQLAGAGAELMLVARRREALDSIAAPIRASGTVVHCLTADLSLRDEVAALIEQVQTQHDALRGKLLRGAQAAPNA